MPTVCFDHLPDDVDRDEVELYDYDQPPGQVNVPLLRKVLEKITAHPEEWDQADWARTDSECGTAFCLAGHTALEAGHQVKWQPCRSMEEDFCPCGQMFATTVTTGETISQVARRELGLSDQASQALFGATNSLDELWSLASLFSGGEIQRPLSQLALAAA